MRFFTPDLYRRFNSSNDAVADRANADWDKALEAYRIHLGRLQKKMPQSVKELSTLALHDAEIVTRFEKGPRAASPFWLGYSAIILRQNGNLLALIYFLWNEVEERESISDWPFDRTKVHWLYDEIDTASESQHLFLHRILLSDGRVLQIPFVTAHFHEFTVSDADAKRKSKKPA